MESKPSKNEGLEFPCEFPLKVIGTDSEEFQRIVVEVIRRHVPDLHQENVSTRPSTGGKYVAVSATFIATSREQLDALYRELGAYDQVIMIL